ncbi:Rrf2 family transcriptional regulator [Gammaproteobacteria bacterium]|nr:Rrf2 family transcriptional regulator [Gammaproteobacteria bacterium]
MLRITRETDYAILIMSTLACADAEINTASIASLSDISQTMASKILKMLVKATLLVSSRGANGGYKLSKPASQINVADIVAAIEGPVSINNCTGIGHNCERSDDCTLAPHWVQINQIIFQALSNVYLSDLILPPKASKLASKLKTGEISFPINQLIKNKTQI